MGTFEAQKGHGVSMDEVLRTEKLNVGYRNKIIVENVDLLLKAGEIFTLIGPNGAGKSTIIKTLSRQISALSGKIFLCKKNMENMQSQEIAKSMAIVTTERSSAEYITCEEMVSMGRYPYTGTFGTLSDIDYEKVEEAIGLLKLNDIRNRRFSDISDGQKQRVLIARALSQGPQLLILDEPTSFLDIKYKLGILRIIKRLAAEKNMAVLMSLHELEYARQVSDRIICVKGGRIDKIAGPSEIYTGNYIKTLYDLDEDVFDNEIGIVKI